MLFKPNWSKLDLTKALKKIDEVNDAQMFVDAVRASGHREVKLAAINRINEPEVLLCIAQENADISLQLHCLIKIPENPKAQMLLADALIRIDKNTDFLSLQIAPVDSKTLEKAIDMLTQDNRARVALQAQNYSIYYYAIEKVTEQTVLSAYVRKHYICLPLEILDKLDEKSLEFIARNEKIQSLYRHRACGQLGHFPDGKNKCRCSVCGFQESLICSPGFGLHDFKDDVCTRCGAVINKRKEVIFGRDGQPAAHCEKTMIRYLDGEERVVLSDLYVEREDQFMLMNDIM